MKLHLGQPVAIGGDVHGEVGDIVIDPVLRSVTHLIVQPHHHHEQARLVPIGLVTERDGTVELGTDATGFGALDEVAGTDYVEVGQPIELGSQWDVGTHRVVVPATFGPMTDVWLMDPDHVGVHFDRIPKGTCEIRATSPVLSADGHRIGRVEGFLINDKGATTSVVVRCTRRTRRHYVPVSLDDVSRIRTDSIDLRLIRSAFQALPPVDDVFFDGNPTTQTTPATRRFGAGVLDRLQQHEPRPPRRPRSPRPTRPSAPWARCSQ